MKKLSLVATVIALALATWWLWPQHSEPLPENPPPLSAPRVDAPTATAVADVSGEPEGRGLPATDDTAVHPLSYALGGPGTPPETEPALLLDMLDGWRRLTGRYPTAEGNRELLALLRRTHSGSPRLFPEQHPRYNANGELTDAWGTPFFFHHISGHHIEVRSAGPDRMFYTDDDVVAPRRPNTLMPNTTQPRVIAPVNINTGIGPN